MSEAFLLASDHRITQLNLDGAPRSGPDLADQVLECVIEQAGINPILIENIIWGGEPPNQTSKDIPITQIMRPGLSGLQALFFAQRAIAAGDMQIVSAGGADLHTPAKLSDNNLLRQMLDGILKDNDADAYRQKLLHPTCGAAAFIVASTQMIGSHNYVPKARLAGMFQSRLDTRSIHNGFASLMERILLGSGVQLSDIDILIVDAVLDGIVTKGLGSEGFEQTKIFTDLNFPLLNQTGEAKGAIFLSHLLDTFEQNKKQWGLVIQIGKDLSLMGMVVERI